MSIAQVIVVITVNTTEDDSNWVNGIIFPWTYKVAVEWKEVSMRITGFKALSEIRVQVV